MTIDPMASAERCRQFRKRILDLSQTVPALHIAPAFSAMELTDVIYFELMRRDANGESPDTFLMSKGHGCMSQYAALEHLGVLKKEQLDAYCTPEGILGGHPDYGNPGIEASTGSLGHGLSMAVGMAAADRVVKKDSVIYVILSDGELQEGSVWEAFMTAPTIGITNVVAMIDLNDMQSLGRSSELHPNLYPVTDKLEAFGWQAREVDGHNAEEIFEAVTSRNPEKPLAVVARTVKGKGVSYMENVPMWHYRSPNPEEYT